jgi:hypothetical protein
MDQIDTLEQTSEADIHRPRGQVLKGQYVSALQSDKGKLKGLVLKIGDQEHAVKLPKYLRPILTKELEPEALVQVWAYPEKQVWRAISIMPLAKDGTIPAPPPVKQAPKEYAPEEPMPADEASPVSAKKASKKALKKAKAPKKASAKQKDLCIQVCRKGTCFKRGGKQVLQALQAEVEANPDLQHVTISGVGCMDACKKGPNIRLPGSKKPVNHITPESAIAKLSEYRKG